MNSEFPGIEKLIVYENQMPLKSDERQFVRRVAVIKLLGWLLDRAESDARSPLRLKAGTAWSEQVHALLKEDISLNRLFFMTPDILDFRQEITEGEQRRVEQLVAARYSPPIFDE